MKRNTIRLKNGVATIPCNVIVIRLTDGACTDIGVIKDNKGLLTDLVIISDESLRRLSVKEENDLIDRAIENLPLYQKVRSAELPFPSSDDPAEDLLWFESEKLYFNSISALVAAGCNEYHYEVFR
jgi:hypothetical protein